MWTRFAMSFAFATACVMAAGCEIENCEEGAICEYGDSHGSACHAVCRQLAECNQIGDAERGRCTDACLDQRWHDDDELDDYRECSEESSCSELTRECGRPPFIVPPPRAPLANGSDVQCAPDGATGSVPDAGAGPTPDTTPRADASTAPLTDAAAVPAPTVDAGTAPGAGSGRDAAVPPAADAGLASDGGSAPPSEPRACVRDDGCSLAELCRGGFCRERCAASCECRTGNVCQDSVCVARPPTAMACAANCDCPAGDSCVQNVCVTPS
jgi:hypothetical protein